MHLLGRKPDIRSRVAVLSLALMLSTDGVSGACKDLGNAFSFVQDYWCLEVALAESISGTGGFLVVEAFLVDATRHS